jgi:hypothetical protein
MADNKMHNSIPTDSSLDLYEITTNLRQKISLKDMINCYLPFAVFCPVHSFRGNVASVSSGLPGAFLLLPSTSRPSASKIFPSTSASESQEQNLDQLNGLAKARVAFGALLLAASFVDLGTLGVLWRKGVATLRIVPFSCTF